MRQIAVFLILAVLLAAAAPPATAAPRPRDWVAMANGWWVDRASIRRDGDLVYYDLALDLTGDQKQLVGYPMAFNCRTMFISSVRDGRLSPVGGVTATGELAAAYVELLCR